jgi:hypothetical protein
MKKKASRDGRFFPDPTPALVRARRSAEEIARATGTAIVIAKDGKVVRIQPKPRRRKAVTSRRTR